MKNHSYYVYIMASTFRGILYTGMCSDLSIRVIQHKVGYYNGFTNKYNIYNLVWYEETNDVNEALLREKQIKKWKRAWKISLVEENNPNWRDLSEGWFTPKDIEGYKQKVGNNL